jgi:transposase InsO family protein
MDARLVAAVSGSLEGLNVAGLCRSLGISRQSFYKWRARYGAEGLEGLQERSRAPRRRPHRLSAEIEDVVVEVRKRRLEAGLDAGAWSIRAQLARAGTVALPSEATIWRALKRRGFIEAQPAKRPKSSWRRFEASRPNELWQTDHTEWPLWHGPVAQVLNFLDDCSRACLRSAAAFSVTTVLVWDEFSRAGEEWGLPRGCLSDNGLAFSGKLRGFEVEFEKKLRASGIKAITSAPFHPQTCGKVERFQQTQKKWLYARRQSIRTLADLQLAVDEFRHFYNYHRPHRALSGATPYERWSAGAKAGPAAHPLASPGRCSTLRVSPEGVVTLQRRWRVHIGVEYQGLVAQVLQEGDYVAVFVGATLVRQLEIDPSRNYQGSGRPRGGPRHDRLG